MTKLSLDELDYRLIEAFGRNARISNGKIAKQLGTTEGTVRTRLKRMQNDGLIAFTAVTSLEQSQQNQMAFIRAKVEITRAHDIAGQIAELKGVEAVILTLATYNVLVVCLFDSVTNLHELVSNYIQKIPGVDNILTSIAVKTLKYNPKIGRLIAEDIGKI